MLAAVKLPFGKTIFQFQGGHSVTSDSANLVDFVLENTPREKLRILELGSGNGIVSIMLSHYRPNWKIYGIDIQPKLVELSLKNAQITNAIIKFREADLRHFQSEKFDIIISNPPYFKKDEGRVGPSEIRALARHEILCNMNDVLFSIERNLKNSGTAFLLYPKSRLLELEKITKKIDLKITQKKVLSNAIIVSIKK